MSLTVGCLALGVGLSSPGLTASGAEGLALQAPVQGMFPSTSVWEADVSGAPAGSDSGPLVANLAGQVSSRYGGVAAFNLDTHSSSFYTVGPAQGRITVKWDDCQGKGYTPPGLFGPGGQFVDVPIPAGAVAAAGSDAGLTVYQPGTDTLWDFWRVRGLADGWHACWGGRIDNVSKGGGWFANGFGASASGLVASAGAIGIREAQSGAITHAVGLAIPDVAVGTKISWPAQRSDGTDASADAIPAGTRFRLDPGLDVDSLHLHPLASMVAKAVQKYGFIVTDRAGAVAVTAESGAATRASTGVDPWTALLAGSPNYDVLKGFPWNRLQALPRNYGKP